MYEGGDGDRVRNFVQSVCTGVYHVDAAGVHQSEAIVLLPREGFTLPGAKNLDNDSHD